jgi:hypothetical protein
MFWLLLGIVAVLMIGLPLSLMIARPRIKFRKMMGHR